MLWRPRDNSRLISGVTNVSQRDIVPFRHVQKMADPYQDLFPRSNLQVQSRQNGEQIWTEARSL